VQLGADPTQGDRYGRLPVARPSRQPRDRRATEVSVRRRGDADDADVIDALRLVEALVRFGIALVRFGIKVERY
jgi:hypothetical protein